jgi:hypothetical protein
MKRFVLPAVAVVVAALAATLYLRSRAPAPADVAPPPAAPATPPAVPDAPLPPPADSDTRLRALIGPLSPRPELRAWLSASELLDRCAVVLVNLAEGTSPAKQLPFLKPEGDFQPGKFDRYDTFADVIASVDAQGFARVLREVHPLLETAYHRLGYPDRSVDELIAKALHRLTDAPVVEKAELRRVRSVYVYADPKLEELGPVEKQLLRLGPRNERLVQEKAREIAAALQQR